MYYKKFYHKTGLTVMVEPRDYERYSIRIELLPLYDELSDIFEKSFLQETYHVGTTRTEAEFNEEGKMTAIEFMDLDLYELMLLLLQIHVFGTTGDASLVRNINLLLISLDYDIYYTKQKRG